jgi:hypothetical protein
MGVQNLLSQASACFEKLDKLLVTAAFAVVSTHQSALGWVMGYDLFSLDVFYKAGLCLC